MNIKLRKYPNRKLYAPKGEITDEGTYVTLEDIAELIKNGNSIEVTNNFTKQDVTNEVLKEVVRLNKIKLTNDTMLDLIRR